MKKENLIIVSIKSWNIREALKFKEDYKGKYNIFIFNKKNDLTYLKVKKINPRYIFFPHWSWIIPDKIYKSFECVVFHMTDVPFGRGGSPLQNLILNKIYNTKISAIKVCRELDAGEVYLKKDFHIGKGSAEEIFIRASKYIFSKMIPYILKKAPKPYKQKGKIVKFKRRKPEESSIVKHNISNPNDFYDFIRMLDAEGYPKAFLKIKDLKIELSGVYKKTNKLIGRFEVTNEK